MTDRAEAVARAQRLWDDGSFLADLRRYVAIPTESQEPERHPDLRRYLTDEMVPAFRRMGYATEIFQNSDPTGGPFLLAERIKDPSRPPVLPPGTRAVDPGPAPPG